VLPRRSVIDSAGPKPKPLTTRRDKRMGLEIIMVPHRMTIKAISACG
jgi:hypothetical protein